jgi:hypothetical protein
MNELTIVKTQKANGWKFRTNAPPPPVGGWVPFGKSHGLGLGKSAKNSQLLYPYRGVVCRRVKNWQFARVRINVKTNATRKNG